MSQLEDDIHRHLARATGELPDRGQIAELVRRADPLRSPAEIERSVAAIEARLVGLGPLEPLLADPLVTDVMVNGPGLVWIERAGAVEPTEVQLTRSEVDLLVERIVGPLGRRADPLHALVDGTLADGSRVHLAVPPIAVDGPYVTIRRFGARTVPLEEFGSEPAARMLRAAVRARANVLVSGSTGSGKTTLLNAMAAEIGTTERVVTIEDAAELRLPIPHVVRLEARPAAEEASSEVTIRSLLRNALRMRPDRLVVGEVRGAEALELITSMTTGHDGSMSTIHANSATDALERLQTLVLLADAGLPFEAVGAQVARAVDLVVHVARAASGRRHIHEVVEVVPGDGGSPVASPLIQIGPPSRRRRVQADRAGGSAA